jgi:hypothetical protein
MESAVSSSERYNDMVNIATHQEETGAARSLTTERAIAEAQEAQALMEAIFNSVRAYYDYLDRHGRFYDVKSGRVFASALHVICGMCGTEIVLGMARSVSAPAPMQNPEPKFLDFEPDLDEEGDDLPIDLTLL